MKVTLLATGKCREASINALAADYLTRLKPLLPTTLVEIPQAKESSPAAIKSAEAVKQRAAIPAGSYVVALDERGSELATADLAAWLKKRMVAAKPLCFVIGGAEGLDPDFLNQADERLSLSKLTLPHMLVRVVLLEQLYRAVTINTGHPYHRA